MSLDDRKIVDKMILDDKESGEIIKLYPELQKTSISRHRMHMGTKDNELTVAAHRLANDNARALMTAYNPEAFIVSVRERLEAMTEDSLTIAESYNYQILDNHLDLEELKALEELRKSAFSNVKNILAALNTVSGLKQLIDLNQAFRTITTEGYEVVEPTLKRADNSNQSKEDAWAAAFGDV